jgi:hypothetical protein
VRPGSRTKVSVPLVLPQNRHPEQSASPIDRAAQSLGRGVEGPRRCLSSPMLFEAFNRRSLTMESVAIRTCFMKAVAGPPAAGFGGWKAPNSMSTISTADVLRLRAPSSVSRDQSVRRFAQDDDSVGELTERRPLCGSRGALQVPRLRSG